MARPTLAEAFETLPYGEAPESAAAAHAWIAAHGESLPMYIGGQWLRSAQTFESVNPATGKPLTRICQASDEDVDRAVKAARAALPAWRALEGWERARYLYALARGIQRHSRLFAVLETLDNGKPIRETRDIDIPLVARHFYHHAGWAQLLEREFPDLEAVGVCGQIIPWNFPLLMLAWKVAPALAAGCTVVLKPAEFTSITAIRFAQLCQAVGLPEGVVNIITGDGQVGAALVAHPEVDKIAFTGSTEVGRIIRQKTAGSGKKLSLELGGKSPFIVFEDADLDSVVEGVVDAIWFNQGQVCCAGSRLLVQENIAERLVSKLKARMEKLRIGDPLDKAVDIGAIIAPVQLQKIQALVERGLAEGAQLWQPSVACPTEGYFFPPSLFTNVAPSSTIAQVEIFGPVLVVMTFRTPAEAVALANNTPYGLAASVWSDNLNLSLDIARKVKAGTVWINATNLFDAASGFGGYRESGYGREGGREGMYEYLTEKRAASERPQAVPAQLATPLSTPVAIDRTPKLFIGGKQARPDSGYSLPVYGADGRLLGEVGEGNRKDIRNAVEAAHAAESWQFTHGHQRAQILYYLAENLAARSTEFAARLAALTGMDGTLEVQMAVKRLFTYAAWADKYDGLVHSTPLRGVVLAIPEPIGVIGILCPNEAPLLSLISLLAPAMAMGNTVVLVPSEAYPLIGTDFYQVLETSDVPSGAVNIVTGKRDVLAKTLAEHEDVDAVWYFGTPEGVKLVESASISNLKRTWAEATARNWFDRAQGEGQHFLRAATQVKNIWTPYGE
ncbi:MAG: aldehyde dehydrogenase [Candidatus Thermofonsia Clade 1 bacterium]|jgi:aldehyde dehydrogenase (NAD+)|uniref:Aldehyde dehydrogenase n=1 Tax=Candidatus Thermofonsia Clade 1 bacterium TaxID=2364210 RepID=A0A2M8PEB2_9CHLR|nr:MAG: aldehyde dehydrogenase [Candidatus Thermofonsia Clade 1 bacterium]RMF53804.1 MAG: aldehyde dehydrogenase family protein [Chloroflexota bacterium]